MFGIGFKHVHYAELLENPAHYSQGSAKRLDFLEVHSENFFSNEVGGGGAARATLTQARSHWPISLHGVGLALGSAAGLDPWHLDQLADLVQQIDPVLVSDHACFARGSLPRQALSESAVQTIHACDLLPVPFSSETLSVLTRHIHQVQERIKRPLAVENLSAYFVWQDADFSEVDFLSELVKRTGCWLLIDVNNIYVNALNQAKVGVELEPLASCIDWLDNVDAKAVAEIHVAGHRVMPDIVIDDHASCVSEPVWTLYAHAFARFSPTNPRLQTLVEWDSEIPSLEVLLGELNKAQIKSQSLCLSTNMRRIDP